jgi:hypothetical protein
VSSSSSSQARQSLRPHFLDPLHSTEQIGDQASRILGRRKVSQPLHALEVGPFDLLAGRLRHLRGRRPIVLAGQEIHGAFLAVDLADALAGVKAAKVEVEIAVEDTVRLARVQVPDEQLSYEDSLSAHVLHRN